MSGSVLVVGAGVGGLCAAARLAELGRRVTLVERLRHVGGRWSTREVDGFKLPTGAFLIAMDDPLAATFADLGLEFPVRPIEERTVYLVEGELVGTGERGGLRALLGAAARHDGSDADAVLAAIRGALGDGAGTTDEPLPEWLAARGAGPSVRAALHALTQAFMGLNAKEVPASAFFDYLRASAGRGRHGIPPRGSRHLAEILAGHVTARGGEVLLGTSARCALVEDGRVAGVVLRDGRELRADVVVSDVGLDGTAQLLDGTALEGRVPGGEDRAGAPGITCFVASREPFFQHPAVVVTGTRCVCLVTTPHPGGARAGPRRVALHGDDQHVRVVVGRLRPQGRDGAPPGRRRRSAARLAGAGSDPPDRHLPGFLAGVPVVAGTRSPGSLPGAGAGPRGRRREAARLAGYGGVGGGRPPGGRGDHRGTTPVGRVRERASWV
ncbi:MAG: FAD-dependent oxidoreductase [Acidimicrobiia bacterium]|nr:FAD-dependent oxidoreductase [Acidimicrobiia bacterium]